MKTKMHVIVMVLTMLAYFSGLCTARAFYDPGMQRWLNRDPIEEQGGLNLFTYVRNSPVSEIDPLGLKFRNPGIWPVQVLQCIAAQAKILNAKLNKALDDLNSCLSRCNSKSYCLNNECRENCDKIYNLDLASAATYYTAASLGCLASASNPSNPPGPVMNPPPPIQVRP